MQKRLKINKHTKVASFLRWLDTLLTSRINKIIAVVVTATFYFFLFDGIDVFTSLYLAVCTVWGYLSCRKYGWLDTSMFIVVLPFMIMSSIITLIFSNRQSKRSLDFAEFSVTASEQVTKALNEIYAGTVIDTHIVDDQVYVKVELPFGLKVPQDEMIATIATGLRISPATILFDPISESRNYYVFSTQAVQEYEDDKYTYLPFMTFAGLRDRLLFRTSLRFNQQPPRG